MRYSSAEVSRDVKGMGTSLRVALLVGVSAWVAVGCGFDGKSSAQRISASVRGREANVSKSRPTLRLMKEPQADAVAAYESKYCSDKSIESIDMPIDHDARSSKKFTYRFRHFERNPKSATIIHIPGGPGQSLSSFEFPDDFLLSYNHIFILSLIHI